MKPVPRLPFARLRTRVPRGRIRATHPKRPDRRRLVKDPTALRTFVDTTVFGDIAMLPTSSQRDLAMKIRRWLSPKRTVNSVINAIVELTKDNWEGVSAHTLKDAHQAVQERALL
jgi:hypothetical protein